MDHTPVSRLLGAGLVPDTSFIHSFIHSFIQSTNQSINQSFNQSINQSINQLIRLFVNCMAWPRRQDGLVIPRTSAELRTICERGHRDFHVALAQSDKKGEAIEVVDTLEAKMVDQ